MAKQVNKHQLTGLDLVDITEQNLSEMGIANIHDRKNVLRHIKQLKNDPYTSYGVICVKLIEGNSQQQMKIKITECGIKVKNIIRQAIVGFKNSKNCESQYTLTQLLNQIGSNQYSLSNDAMIHDFMQPGGKNEFLLARSSNLIESNNGQPFSINSPLRLRSDMENSLERLINSPTQTIYVQPMDDNEDVLQLNSLDSQSTMKTKSSRKSQPLGQKSSLKRRNHQSHSKPQSRTKMSFNTAATSNRETLFNQSSNSNYLQNYITANKQSHKKQQSSTSSVTSKLVVNENHFQTKKHSVNDTAFNYNRGVMNHQVTSLQSNSQVGHTNPINTGSTSSLSRGNSMKKMKTFCNGSNNGPHVMKSNHKAVMLTSNNQKQLNNLSKYNKKTLTKGKGVNMYCTLNGPQNNNHKVLRSNALQAERAQNNLSNETNKENLKNVVETQRVPNTPSQNTQTMNEKLIYSNQQCKRNKLSFVHNENQLQNQDKNHINNLNEILYDFLDEQSTVHQDSMEKIKLPTKTKTNSLHSRQQVLFEEDSLESTKKSDYEQNQVSQQNDLAINSQLSNQALPQRSVVKHMSHKSMYALNTHQSKTIDTNKRTAMINTTNNNQHVFSQHFGTFDNTLTSNQHHNATTLSDSGENNLILNENYNISNYNYAHPQYQKMHTEVATSDKENKHARDEGNQLKRGGTIGKNHNNNGYGRSDSNTNKHRNNRYSDQCDDMLMLDMSEEESVLIKQKQ